MSRFALYCTAVFFLLLLLMLLGVALMPNLLASPSPLGLTYGHLLILIIHICPVAAAWYYIGRSES